MPLPVYSPFSPKQLSGLVGWWDASALKSTKKAPNEVAGLQAWWKADAITGLADNDAVTSWPDSSGHGRTMAQDTGAVQPNYKVNIINGRPVVRFAAGDFLHTGAYLTGTGGFSMFVVAKVDANRANRQDIFGTSATTAATGWKLAAFTTDGQMLARGNAGGTFSILQDYGSFGTFKLFSLTWTGSLAGAGNEANLYHDGLLLGSSGLTDALIDASDVFLGYAGSDENFVGDIAEVAFFSGAVSAADRQAIELYLSDKYAIGTAIASWPDISGGSAADMAQATDAAKPLYVSSATNGRPALRFDGSNDTMTAAIAADTSHTLFVVAKKVSAVGATTKDLIGYHNFSQLYANSGVHATSYNWFQQQDGSNVAGVGSITAADWHVITLRLNSASSMDIGADGAAVQNFDPHDEVSTSTTLALCSNTAGANFGDYDVAEVILYDTALSALDRARVERYLANKYGITVT
jgi:hypothetical protein